MYLLSKFGSLRSFGRWNGNSYHLSCECLRKLNTCFDQKCWSNRFVKSEINRQRYIFEPGHFLTFSRRSNNEYMNIHIFLPNQSYLSSSMCNQECHISNIKYSKILSNHKRRITMSWQNSISWPKRDNAKIYLRSSSSNWAEVYPA